MPPDDPGRRGRRTDAAPGFPRRAGRARAWAVNGRGRAARRQAGTAVRTLRTGARYADTDRDAGEPGGNAGPGEGTGRRAGQPGQRALDERRRTMCSRACGSLRGPACARVCGRVCGPACVREPGCRPGDAVRCVPATRLRGSAPVELRWYGMSGAVPSHTGASPVGDAPERTSSDAATRRRPRRVGRDIRRPVRRVPGECARRPRPRPGDGSPWAAAGRSPGRCRRREGWRRG